jgi:hypothetical protein
MLPPMSNQLRKWLLGIFALAVVGGLVTVSYKRAPRNTFNLFCAYHFAYRLNVTIEIDGKRYHSQAMEQVLKPRDWSRGFGGSCRESLGSVIAFRPEDNRLVLMGAGICPKALEAFGGTYYHNPRDNFVPAMSERRKVDLFSPCMGIGRDRRPALPREFVGYDGFVVDNADEPTRWRGFNFDGNNVAGDIRIVSAVAEADNAPPEDGLEKIAPEILKTDFEYTNWSRSPEVIFFSRSPPADRHAIHTAEEE